MSIHKRSTKTKGFVYEVRLRLPDGREMSKSFRTKREAEAFQSQQRADLSRSAWSDPRLGARTFGSWADEWLTSNPAKRAKTLASDEAALRQRIYPSLANQRLAAIRPAQIQRLVNAWCTELAASSVRRHYAVVAAVLNAAVEQDLIGRSPCRGIKLPAVVPASRVSLSPEDVDMVAAEVAPRFSAAVYVGAVLGLRFGEVFGLRVLDLDLMRRRLTVAKNLVEVNGKIELGEPKSRAGRRAMAMPPFLSEMLSVHLAEARLTGSDTDHLVFTTAAGTPVRYSNFRTREWLPACQAAGLPKGVGFHDLRRASATAMVRTGVDLKTAQTRLGHQDPRLTLAIYAQSTTAGDDDAADKLGAFFGPPASQTDLARGQDAG